MKAPHDMSARIEWQAYRRAVRFRNSLPHDRRPSKAKLGRCSVVFTWKRTGFFDWAYAYAFITARTIHAYVSDRDGSSPLLAFEGDPEDCAQVISYCIVHSKAIAPGLPVPPTFAAGRVKFTRA